jgi:hypothetical protein
MDAQVRRPNKLTTVLGLVTAAMGAFFAVVASGVIALGPERTHEDPRWVSVLFGVIFLLGGAAVAVGGVLGGNEQDPDGLPPATPGWLRWITQLMALAIVVCFGAIFSWIGFGPGQRSFEGSRRNPGPDIRPRHVRLLRRLDLARARHHGGCAVATHPGPPVRRRAVEPV